MKRKLVAILLAACTISGTVASPMSATNVWAAEEERETEGIISGDFRYTVNEDETTISIAGYQGDAAMLVIPEELDGKKVTAIGESAFSKCNSLKKVEIPKGVTKIGRAAFYHCESLEKVEFPDGIKVIEDQAFENCNQLQRAFLPDSVESLGWGVFFGCDSLGIVNIPEGVTDLGFRLFSDCTSLESIEIPGNVKSIGGMTFAGCKKLKKIELPKGLQEVAREAFLGCAGLEEVIINGKETTLRTAAFSGCGALEDVYYAGTAEDAVQYGVEFQPEITVHYNYGGRDVEIGRPCTIGDFECYEYDTSKGLAVKIYKYLGNEKNLVIPEELDGRRVSELEEGLFSNCKTLESIKIPEGVERIDRRTFEACVNLETVELPDSVKDIEWAAFMGCGKLKNINMPKSLKSIAFNAFAGCRSLESVEFSEGFSYIGLQAFAGCTGLERIELPESVESIYRGAFEQCINLKEVVINGKNTQVHYEAFRGCNVLGDIYYVGTEEEWRVCNAELNINPTIHYNYQKDADKTEEVSVDEGIAGTICGDFKYTIDENGDGSTVSIVEYLGKDKKLVIPEELDGKKVTDISMYAIMDSKYLESLTVSRYVERISGLYCGEQGWLGEFIVDERNPYYMSEDGIIYNKDKTRLVVCPKGKSGEIVVPEGITVIGENAFSDCIYVENIVLPQGLTTIEEWAFCGCGFDSITIPEGVTKIGDNAFNGCNNLRDMVVPDSATHMEGLFIGCEKLETVKLPERVEFFEGIAFAFCSRLKSVKIPEGTKSIYSSMFEQCISLENVEIPEGVTCIESGAFMECRDLDRIEIPAGVKEIGEYAFENCVELKEITINEKEFIAYEDTFAGCKALKDIYYAGTEEEWKKLNIVLDSEATVHYNYKKDAENTKPETTVQPEEVKEYTVNISSDGNGIATVSVKKAAEDTVVTLSAKANEGYEFKGWQVISGEVKIENDQLLMPAENVSVKALFEKIVTEQEDVTPKDTEPAEEHVKLEETVLTEEQIKPEETALTEEQVKPEETALTEEQVKPEETALTEEQVKPEETALTEEQVKPEETALTEEQSKPEETAPAEEAVKPEETAPAEVVADAQDVTTEEDVMRQGTVDMENPKATKVLKVVAKKKGFLVKWKKQPSETSGYEIQYAESKDFKKAKTIKVKNKKATSKKISKLKADKKYYVRVRTYKTVKLGGKSEKLYSDWSNAKQVEIKK